MTDAPDERSESEHPAGREADDRRESEHPAERNGDERRDPLGPPRPDGGAVATADTEGPVQPVDVLVDLADDGEIDPWDIDVVRVTDRFLDRLDESDLRASARALFYASVLVRMKSEMLLEDEEDEPDPEDPWAEPRPGAPPEPGGPDPFADLEREIDRRIDRKRARGSPRTLDELVRELREIEREARWKESREYDTSDSPKGFRRGTQRLDYRSGDADRAAGEPTAEDVTGTTHAEHIEDLLDDVRAAIEAEFEAGRSEVLFAEIEDAGPSRVQTYLGVLFLCDRDVIDMEQDALFGDLWLQQPGIRDDDATAASALADSDGDEADPEAADPATPEPTDDD
ncbi:segregation/condensation protein A [Halococcoides cellulosivorans]|uniref:Segregation/condensation protein A n=1 Tax=Halococcoides cellulosivorans TaxID=1679096 RepID=A0A2R4X2J4_9EURY|nr:segregation/condensation protein A [Halococcoides cellulosivorans]AWB28039.1 segregation/condensation protein A [Halococcoides cellulosivorans]